MRRVYRLISLSFCYIRLYGIVRNVLPPLSNIGNVFCYCNIFMGVIKWHPKLNLPGDTISTFTFCELTHFANYR